MNSSVFGPKSFCRRRTQPQKSYGPSCPVVTAPWRRQRQRQTRVTILSKGKLNEVVSSG